MAASNVLLTTAVSAKDSERLNDILSGNRNYSLTRAKFARLAIQLLLGIKPENYVDLSLICDPSKAAEILNTYAANVRKSEQGQSNA